MPDVAADRSAQIKWQVLRTGSQSLGRALPASKDRPEQGQSCEVIEGDGKIGRVGKCETQDAS